MPACFASILYYSFGEILKGPNYGVFWSVICESIYYILYPVLFLIRKRASWGVMIGISVCMYLLMMILNFDKLQLGNTDYHVFGLWSWIIGFPCWLSGCWLAENYKRFPELSIVKMFVFRIFVFSVSIILRIAKFHVKNPFASNSITLNMFAIILVLWIGCEIAYYLNVNRTPKMEWLGQWSYSLYLIHPISHLFLLSFGSDHWSSSLQKFANIIVAFAVSYVFFLIVEKPSHRFAKYVSSMKRDERI